MRTIVRCGGGLLAAALFTSVSFGYTWVYSVNKCPVLPAPDLCGPGWYNVGPCGMVYGPNHYVYPPFAPFQGVLPGQTGRAIQQGVNYGNYANFAQPAQQRFQNQYPTHPYARSPRDFFMWTEVMEDLRGRDIRPNFVP